MGIDNLVDICRKFALFWGIERKEDIEVGWCHEANFAPVFQMILS